LSILRHDTLQHTATHCNTLQHTATHCNTLQHTATHCNAHLWIVRHASCRLSRHNCVLSNVIILVNQVMFICEYQVIFIWISHDTIVSCELWDMTHCNTLQHTLVNCETFVLPVNCVASCESIVLSHIQLFATIPSQLFRKSIDSQVARHSCQMTYHVARTHMTCHTYEWVMSHTHLNEPCRRSIDSQHSCLSSQLCHVARVKMTRHTYEWVMSHIYSWVMSHIWMRPGSREPRTFHPSPIFPNKSERWGAGVETQKNVRRESGGWGRVPFNEPYAPSLSTIYDGA